ncbi:MAG TPA: IucA/IucC family protein [Acidimicrobiales bacterium]
MTGTAGGPPGAPSAPDDDASDAEAPDPAAPEPGAAVAEPAGPAAPDLVAAERRVLRQLIEALTFEGLLRPRPDGRGGWTLPAGDACYRWRGGERFAFGRPRIDGPVRRSDAEVTSARQFLADVAADPDQLGAGKPPDPARLASLADELERTALNEADALAAWRDRPVPGPDAAYDDLETWTVAGHLYHPCYKSRLGFDRADNRRYGPEWGPTVRPRWLALPAEETERWAAAGVDPDAFLDAELGPAAERFRARAGDGRVLVPVHPWQWRERLAPRLAGPIAAGRVVDLGEAGDDYRPQQSIRTLANVTHPAKASLKLALGVVTTSTARTLAPHTLRNGPLITDWLRTLVAGDPVLRDDLRLGVLGEVLTVAHVGPRPPLPGGPDGQLGCLWRESVPPRLGLGEAAVPFTTLTQRTPAGRPFVGPWVEAWGVDCWAGRLVEVAVAPVIRLLLTHGIALEAHAQNLVLVHRDGLPERLIVRDLHDGIRFSRRHLAEPDRAPVLAPTPAAHLRVNRNSFVETDDPEAVRDFVLDAFLFVNLAEVAFVLADDFGLDERRFWAGVRAVVERHRGPLAVHFDVFAPTVGIEQLAGRRLLPDDRLRIRRAPNPLACVAAHPLDPDTSRT